jgi:hypothetical protein
LILYIFLVFCAKDKSGNPALNSLKCCAKKVSSCSRVFSFSPLSVRLFPRLCLCQTSTSVLYHLATCRPTCGAAFIQLRRDTFLCRMTKCRKIIKRSTNSYQPPPTAAAGLGAHQWTQSYDFDYNAGVVKIYNATGSLARFDNKNIFFYFEKRSSLLQRWGCSCKFKSRRIGSWF